MTLATTVEPARHGHSGRGRRLLWFVGRRFAALVALLIGISLVSFTLSNVVPADPAVAALGEVGAGNPAAVAAFREAYGLNDPLPVQYKNYAIRLLHGDLGTSFRTGAPVLTELKRAIPATMELAILAIIIAIIMGVSLGTVAAIRKDSWIDQVVRLITLGGVSVPTFWLGLMLYYVFFFRLGWAPSGGRLDPALSAPPTVTGSYVIDAILSGDGEVLSSALQHLILPACVISASSIAVIARFTRSAVLEVLQAEYVTVARAKGLQERTVIFRYVLRAALVPIVSLLGVCFGHMLAGAVLTEHIFSWPGIGQLAYVSATNLDVNGIMGVCLFVGASYVIVNFVVDLLYTLIDPRIRLE